MPKQPRFLPVNLRQLTFNPTSGLYDAEEDGVVYHLTFEQMNQLKSFYFCNQFSPATYGNWYNHLDKFDKQNVKRSGVIPTEPNNFYPDIEPEY